MKLNNINLQHRYNVGHIVWTHSHRFISRMNCCELEKKLQSKYEMEWKSGLLPKIKDGTYTVSKMTCKTFNIRVLLLPFVLTFEEATRKQVNVI